MSCLLKDGPDFVTHSHSFSFWPNVTIDDIPTIYSVEEIKMDEYGIEMKVKSRKIPPLSAYSKNDVFVPPVLAKWLRPHQREGVQFMYECVMGLKKDFHGNGCILADDMGLVRSCCCCCCLHCLGCCPPSACRRVIITVSPLNFLSYIQTGEDSSIGIIDMDTSQDWDYREWRTHSKTCHCGVSLFFGEELG